MCPYRINQHNEEAMRELSLQELHQISGGDYSSYFPEKLAPVSAASGYTIGVLIRSIKVPSAQCSATGMANAVSYAQRTYKFLQKTIIPTNLADFRPLEVVIFFGCGVQQGLVGRT